MTSSEQPRIDWATAEIEGGTLNVGLAGERPKGWAKRFGVVLALLEQSASGLGKIALHKQRITVAGVQEGSEEDLRHLLTSVVLQVNSDFETGEGQGVSGTEDDPRAEIDQRMTDRFREFAERDS